MAAFKLTKKEADDLNQLFQNFDLARQTLFDALDDIAGNWESELSERSEKWQESGAGQNAQERIDMVRGWADELPGDGEPAIDTDALR